AGQVSVSLILLVLALLFVRSVRNLLTADTGFRRDGIIFAGFGDMSGTRGTAAETRTRLLALQAALLEQVRSTPGVESAASSSQLPLTGSSWTQGVHLEEGRGSSKFTYITSDYFRTMRIPIRGGRDVNDFDTPEGRNVALVNETFAQRYLGAGDAIG